MPLQLHGISNRYTYLCARTHCRYQVPFFSPCKSLGMRLHNDMQLQSIYVNPTWLVFLFQSQKMHILWFRFGDSCYNQSVHFAKEDITKILGVLASSYLPCLISWKTACAVTHFFSTLSWNA